MTSKNDILKWLENEDIRLNKRLEESYATNQEHTSLSGSLLTVQLLLRLIRTNKVKFALNVLDEVKG